MKDGTLLALGAVGVLAVAGAARRRGSRSGDPVSLRELPYPADALAPEISERTVKLHHGKHQRGYVEGLDRSLRELDHLRGASGAVSDKRRRERRLELAREVAYNGSGVILHELYWENMRPASAGRGQTLQPELNARLRRAFGSFPAFVEAFTDVALAIRGSGWAVLAWSPRLDRLVILPVGRHENEHLTGAVPILVCDVWEHAYYLDRQNRRKDYLGAFWRLVDWGVVARRLRSATAS